MLKLDKVSKVYKVGTFGGSELLAVSDVSFDVEDGEVVSLIGESGSGKTELTSLPLRVPNSRTIIGPFRVSFKTPLALIIQSLKQTGFLGSSRTSSSQRLGVRNGATN